MGILNDLVEKARGLNSQSNMKIIGAEELSEALGVLQKYKDGKASLEQRIIEDEEFYKLQHWEYLRRKKAEADKNNTQKPSTAWMLNSVINKHADIMDSYPEANCLPREKSDEQDARALSGIIPVILEHNDYEQIYSDCAWYYIKHGTSVQGVFWDSTKENGLGDIKICDIDILNLFWEPGIKRLEDSSNLFYVSLVDNDVLKETYPVLEGKSFSGSTITVSEYCYDDTIDNSNKSVVVDWYYKKRDINGRTILHYVKFVGNEVLYSSENEGLTNGYYEHGRYPFTMATMYPEAGTPYGFGIISVCRDPQLYIDTLDGLMLDYAYKVTNPRFWAKKSAGINIDDFLDWSKPIVEVEGDIDKEKLLQINLAPMGTAIQNLRQMKVDELKETSSNRDFSQGSTASGVTSGAAIATLQEAGNKTTRDMLKSLYRSYVDVVELVIELIRQFYDEKREFRITGQSGSYEFTAYNNNGIREQLINDGMGGEYFRKPVFDIDVKAQKSNPYSKMSQNETAVNLYNLGIFTPQNAQPALGMLEMMEFDGKEKVKEFVMQGQTLMNVINQQNQQLMQMSQIIAQLTGKDMTQQNEEPGSNAQAPPQEGGNIQNSQSVAESNAKKLHETAYAEKLAGR